MFFVFLGNLGNSKSIGTNNLIKEFAQIVTTPEDILLKYGFLEPCEDCLNIAKYIKLENNVPKEYEDIFNVITEEPTEIDEISHKLKIDLKTLIPKLTMLELEGKIKKVAGNRYMKGDI